MSGRLPRREKGLGALCRERTPFAVLGLVLLVAQLLLAGLSQGAMAGERLERAGLSVICHTLDGENRLVGTRHSGEPDRDCPCLAGACVIAAVLGPQDGPLPVVQVRVPQRVAPARVVRAELERRPLALFARAGRGPPALA